MPESLAEKGSHRSTARYQCPPFFSARISDGDTVDERAEVDNLSLRGLCARTSCDFDEGTNVQIELRSKYSAPVRFRGRVRWVKPSEEEGSSHIIGITITRVRIFDWFRFLRIISQIKREVW